MYLNKNNLIIRVINLHMPISILLFYLQTDKSYNSTLFFLKAVTSESRCHVITRFSLSILNNALSICIIVVF